MSTTSPLIINFTLEAVNQEIPFFLSSEIKPVVQARTFVYIQNTASNYWEIEHNLHKYPSVTVIDSGGTVVVGDVQYIDDDNIICSFSAPFSGAAYLN